MPITLGPEKIRVIEEQMQKGYKAQRIADLHAITIRSLSGIADSLGYRLRTDGTFVRLNPGRPMALTPPKATQALDRAMPDPDPDPEPEPEPEPEQARPSLRDMTLDQVIKRARGLEGPKVESALKALLTAKENLLLAVEAEESRAELEAERTRLREERERINRELVKIEAQIGRRRKTSDSLIPEPKVKRVSEAEIRDWAVEVGRLTPEQRSRAGRVSAALKRAYYEAHPA
jgi:hypothetical protein